MDGIGRYVNIRVKKIANPGQLMFMCDGFGIFTPIYQGFWDQDPGYSTGTTPTARHPGPSFNLVFCDAHVDGGPWDMFYRSEYMYNPS